MCRPKNNGNHRGVKVKKIIFAVVVALGVFAAEAEFTEIIKPKSSWRVAKVNVRQVEQEDGEPIEVYDALTVSIPGRGLCVIVR